MGRRWPWSSCRRTTCRRPGRGQQRSRAVEQLRGRDGDDVRTFSFQRYRDTHVGSGLSGEESVLYPHHVIAHPGSSAEGDARAPIDINLHRYLVELKIAVDLAEQARGFRYLTRRVSRGDQLWRDSQQSAVSAAVSWPAASARASTETRHGAIGSRDLVRRRFSDLRRLRLRSTSRVMFRGSMVNVPVALAFV